MLPALLLVGCGSNEPCPSFDEIEVTDPDGVSDERHLSDLDQFLDTFADWTGRDGICVGEIRVVEDLENAEGRPISGHYGDRLIEIDSHSMGSGDVVMHELCHAIDDQEGWISETRPDLFGAHPHEAFARACSHGPVQLGLARSLDATCGTDLASVPTFVDAVAYPAYEDWTTDAAGTVPVSLDTLEVGGLPTSTRRQATVGGSRLYVVAERPPRHRGAGDAIGGRLIEVDPETAAVVDRFSWPAGADTALVLPSDGDPVVLDTELQRAWRRDPAGGYDELVLPNVGEDVVVWGLVAGEQALMQSVSPEFEYSYWLADLQTGEATELALPDDLSIFWLREVVDGHFEGSAHGSDGRALRVQLDPASETWSSTPVQDWAYHNIARLPDGRLLSTWTLTGWFFDVGSDRTGLAVIDESGEQWWLSGGACDTDLGSNSRPLTVGGETRLWQWNRSDPQDGPTRTGDLLSRVSVGEPN